MNCLKLILTLLSVLVLTGASLVQTTTGPIQGKMVASSKVEAFLGIPYAEPPIGPLRLSKPTPKTPWQDVYDATRKPPACIQAKMTDGPSFPEPDYMSEDCLYLNIWVPLVQSSDEPRIIMLFIHGGGLILGATNEPLYDGAKLAEHGNVVVVTINYRLGGLGFLTDFTDEAPGSLGLYDQVMAIEWIKTNAKHFNGDPENIVLFGESAGAWSISFHQISPLSRKLFKRAILQSGSSLNPEYDDNNTELKKVNQEYSEFMGCKYTDPASDNSPKEILDCLRKVPAEKFSEADMEIYLKRSKFAIPRVGNDFLPENTIDSFRKGLFKNSEVLMGITRDEGSSILTFFRPDIFDRYGKNDVSSIFNKTTTYDVLKSIIKNGDPDEVDKIISGYIENVRDDSEYAYLKAAIEASGDFVITCSNIFQAEYQSLKDNPVFFYMFDHRPVYSPLSEWMGVAHFDEVQFVFGNPMYKHFTEYEKELSRDIMDMWVTFAKTGNPSIPGGISWPRYTYQDPKYFIIGKRDRIGLRPDHNRCERWRKLFRSNIDENLIENLKQKS